MKEKPMNVENDRPIADVFYTDPDGNTYKNCTIQIGRYSTRPKSIDKLRSYFGYPIPPDPSYDYTPLDSDEKFALWEGKPKDIDKDSSSRIEFSYCHFGHETVAANFTLRDGAIVRIQIKELGVVKQPTLIQWIKAKMKGVLS
jgi:hypothetical protein